MQQNWVSGLHKRYHMWRTGYREPLERLAADACKHTQCTRRSINYSKWDLEIVIATKETICGLGMSKKPFFLQKTCLKPLSGVIASGLFVFY